jgi:mannose-6-phosphate isomerase-like protein (cupin superfamily)
MRILVDPNTTDGALSVVEGVIPPGGDGGLHVHHAEDETMYVVSGELEITVGQETRTLVPGDCYFGPRGVPHRVRNVGKIPAKSVAISTPGDFASFVKKAALARLADGNFEIPAQDYMNRVMTAAQEYSIEVLVPPGA